MLIVGLDPGSRVAGYGVVATEGSELRLVDHGIIKMNERLSLAERLLQLNSALESLFLNHPPDVAVIEKVFVGKNQLSALHLGHARGICMMKAAQHGANIVEYATREVKKGITGRGGSDKWTVRLQLQLLLGRTLQEELDATDALALAVHHAQVLWVASRVALAR